MGRVRIAGLHKRFDDFPAIRGVDFEIRDGEFVVLVGPSGCGKSTILRLIAGLEQVTEGTIEFDGTDVTRMAVQKRDVAMVFQSYALYPYMNVFENMAFGLRARRIARDEIAPRVDRVAQMLGIGDLLDRFPRHLSGGQRQRVAIGRAIVREPRLFLFDEPLSNLDAHLREGMRSELKRLHRTLKRTVIYVTHDQVEAMTLADRIILLRGGRIEQMGEPLELFERPANRFVAGFLGSPSMSFVPARLVEANGSLAVAFEDGAYLALPEERHTRLRPYVEHPIVFGVRPEHIGVQKRDGASAGLSAMIDVVEPTGTRSYASFFVAGAPVMAELPAYDTGRPGEQKELFVDMSRVVLIDPKTENVIR